MMVVWLILNMQCFFGGRIFLPILKGVKKLINLKIFVLIMNKMLFVEWWDIDSGMLKLIEKL